MNPQRTENSEELLSSLLSAVDRQEVEPEKEFLDRLKEQSANVFQDTASRQGSARSGQFAEPTFAWRKIMHSRTTKLAAAAAAIIIGVLFGLDFIGGPDMATVAWGKVVENVEKVEWFVFQHQISVTSVADGATIQESETTTYVSSEYGLRQDAYMNDQLIGISYIPPAGKIVTQVMPGVKKYRRVTTSEEYMRKIHEQADPVGMIKEFMSFEHTELGRDIVDGVEAEGIEVNDPKFLTAVFESAIGRLWVDVETDLPVRTEIVGVSGGGSIETKIVAYDFDWHVELEPRVFEPNIPDDYTLLGQ
ncbi:MAG: hypothetical protein JSU70_04250 [Phycisphaerales bacterium]|nr:MAG: hypothetical protein JSU70_04250 [Phycisphaerales bacterium]